MKTNKKQKEPNMDRERWFGYCVEDTSQREIYGQDASAINRHSCRVFRHNDVEYVLDRNLSACPPCFELTERPVRGGFNHAIEINGGRYFGDGWSWRKAEKRVSEHLGMSVEYLELHGEVIVKHVNHRVYGLGDKLYNCGWDSKTEASNQQARWHVWEVKI